MPHTRAGTARAVVVDGRFHLVGGSSTEAAALPVDIYDPSSSGWQQGRGMAVPRRGVMPAAAAGRIFVAGGAGGRGGKSDVFDYYAPVAPAGGEAVVNARAGQTPGARPPRAASTR